MISKRSMFKISFIVSCVLAMLMSGAVAYAAPHAARNDQTLKQKLGKQIFFDANLSEPKGQSCSSCHLPKDGFAEPDKRFPTSEGATPGYFGNRNSPTAAYSTLGPVFAYDASLNHGGDDTGHYFGGLFWDGRADTAAIQAGGPFLNPVEMNNPSKAAVVEKVRKSKYAMLFKVVYGNDSFNDPELAYDKICDAIATYEQSSEVCKFSSKYDQYLKGRTKLAKQEKRGLELFAGKAKCDTCHSDEPGANGVGPLFTDFSFENIGTPKNPKNLFYTMPYNPDGFDYIDNGLGAVIGDTDCNGFMKVPTLRNLTKTAPYMHNGVFTSLKQVVHFYNTRDDGSWPAPEVAGNVHDTTIGNLGLTDKEENDIVAFLKTLTDNQVNAHNCD